MTGGFGRGKASPVKPEPATRGFVAPEDLERFSAMVWAWYRKNGRDLPWRRTRDPWAILVSEFMLQQTQTARVLSFWPAMLGAFPSPAEMAAAPLERVLALWNGLGYNRRAKNMHAAAVQIAEKHDNRVPTARELLLALPGVGEYTAAAVCVFAYGQLVPMIETNIRRVYLQHFFQDESGVPDTAILPLVEASLDRSNPREWFYALMDYGAALGKSRENPNKASAHYARQSKFEGSLRQARGRMLRSILEQGGVGRGELESKFGERAFEAMQGLIKDGMVAESGGMYRIVR